MAFMECHFHSDVLGMATSMNVILPEAGNTQIGMRGQVVSAGETPVLYLLHGLSDDHTIWVRRTSIERYVTPLGLAVVMPNVHRSFYTNMVHGYRYWDFVSEELPQMVASFFHVSTERERTFVAGLSMGGYGALKLALRRPQRFAAGCSLSGAVDMVGRAQRLDDSNRSHDIDLVFGGPDGVVLPENDLFQAASELVAGNSPRPFLYQWCGTSDYLYKGNVAFRQHAESIGLDVLYEEGPGDHQWCYWDSGIQRFLHLLVERGLLGKVRRRVQSA